MAIPAEHQPLQDSTADGSPRRRPRLSFFGPRGAPSLKETGMMASRGFAPPGMVSDEDRELLRRGEDVHVLFRQAGDSGLSLVHVRFAPGYLLPRHSHSADCVYYVLHGEVHLGKRMVRAGEGFFVPKDQPYAYQAGPDGVELLEFRDATSFDFVVHETSPARWRAIVEAARAHEDEWRAADSEI
jgi:quercetin dioxygenase-like cupin family protein